MVLSVFDVAKTFLSFESMTHKKLQKLCYYAQAWHIALFGEKLFNNDFQAWIHGPVCRELYQEYKHYGWLKIPKCDIPKNIDDEKLAFIRQIYDVYGEFTGNELEDITHQEEPWRKARGHLEICEPSYEVIKETDMKEYYLKLYEQGQND